jgi:tetratricopeptide (TPR) repeat protein
MLERLGVNNIADHAQALEALRNIESRAKAILPETDNEFLEMRAAMAVRLANLKRYEESIGILERIVQTRSEQYGSAHPDTLRQTANLGKILRLAGDLERALHVLAQAHQANLATFPEGHKVRKSVALELEHVQVARAKMAYTSAMQRKDFEDALRANHQEVALRQVALDRKPSAAAENSLAFAWGRNAIVHNKLGRATDAVASATQQVNHLRLARKLAPNTPVYKKSLATALVALGDSHLKVQEYRDAAESFEEATTLRVALVSEDGAWSKGPALVRNTRIKLARALGRTIEGLLSNGTAADATQMAQREVDLRVILLAADPESPPHRYALILAQNRLARVLWDTAGRDRAWKVIQDCLNALDQLCGRCPDKILYHRALATLKQRAGTYADVRGEPAVARVHWTEALTLRRDLSSRAPDPTDAAAIRSLEKLLSPHPGQR